MDSGSFLEVEHRMYKKMKKKTEIQTDVQTNKRQAYM